MKTNIKHVIVIITSLLAISCGNSIDGLDEKFSEREKVSVVLKTVSVAIKFNDLHDGRFFYKAEIFDADPGMPGASMLKNGLGSRDIEFVTRFDVPENQKVIYIRQTDPEKKQILKQLDVSVISGTIICDFRN